MKTKICTGTKAREGCGKEKPLSGFRRTKGYRENICRDCALIHQRLLRRDRQKLDKILYGKWE